MGNSRAVHYACALTALAFLGGCNWGRDGTTSEVQQQIIDGDMRLLESNSQQDLKIAELERKVAMLERDLASLDSAHSSLQSTVNNNANAANDNALRDMTSRGACGTERVDYPNGSWTFRNRKCTKADLR